MIFHCLLEEIVAFNLLVAWNSPWCSKLWIYLWFPSLKVSYPFIFPILYDISNVSVSRRGRRSLANELLLYSSLFHHMGRYTTIILPGTIYYFTSQTILILLYSYIWSILLQINLILLFKASLMILCSIYIRGLLCLFDLNSQKINK